VSEGSGVAQTRDESNRSFFDRFAGRSSEFVSRAPFFTFCVLLVGASGVALGRGPQGGPRLRGAQQGARDDPGAAGPQDKGRLLLGGSRPNRSTDQVTRSSPRKRRDSFDPLPGRRAHPAYRLHRGHRARLLLHREGHLGHGRADARRARRRRRKALITVPEHYANLPNVSLIFQNVGQGPAEDISFEFSAPRELRGVLAERFALLLGGADLAPGAKIGRYRDTPDNPLPLIEGGKIASDIAVRVLYKDLNLDPLEHDWDVNPRPYEGVRNVDYSGMTDLVELIDRKIADGGIGGSSS
jgi:hypothetical protein